MISTYIYTYIPYIFDLHLPQSFLPPPNIMVRFSTGFIQPLDITLVFPPLVKLFLKIFYHILYATSNLFPATAQECLKI